MHLKEITIGMNVTTITPNSFYYINSIENIYVNQHNTNFKSNNGVLLNYAEMELVYYPVGNTRKVYVTPYKVTTLKKNSFLTGNHLQIIVIGRKVTSIENTVFKGCKKLKVIAYLGNGEEPSCQSDAFSESGTNMRYYTNYGYDVNTRVWEPQAGFDVTTAVNNLTFPIICKYKGSELIDFRFCDSISSDYDGNDTSNVLSHFHAFAK